MAARGGSSVRLHVLLMLAGLLVPLLLFGAAAWRNHADVLEAGEDSIGRFSALMQEHARKVFETADLVIGQVDERIDGESWAGIEAPSMAELLRRIKAPVDELRSICIADETGLLRVGTGVWTPGLRIAGRGFFKPMPPGDPVNLISTVHSSPAGRDPAFFIIRRRTVPDRSFAGTIHVAVTPETFTRFYAKNAPPLPHVAMLVRGDGTVLAREPAASAASLPEDSPTLRRMLTGGTVAGVAAADSAGYGRPVYEAVRQVGQYPVFVVMAVREGALLAPWFRNLWIYGTAAGCAAAVLLLVSFLALRRARSEEAAVSALQFEMRQRRQAEDQLRFTHRMEVVGQLTGGVAHTFNNLLTVILNNLDLIARAAAALPERDEPTQARIGRLTASGIKAVERGTGLTRSLLAFARRQAMQPQPIDPNQVVEELVPLLAQAAGRTVTVVFEPTPDLPRCTADGAELEAALLNLTNNASDAMPDGGTLVVQTGLVELGTAALAGNTEARPGQFVSISVIDSGCGMPPDVALRALEPFFTTKEVVQGTGLGLSQVYGFVRQLGGHLEIETAPGAGTVVMLCLPVSEP